jgi:recombination protein RecA
VQLHDFAGVSRASLALSNDRSRDRASGPERGAPLGEVFRGGQLLELSGQAAGKLSTVVRLVVRAQAEGEPVVLVGRRDGPLFYPPDAADAGVDLGALVLVRLAPDAPAHELVRAAELLLRSGAFGLVILDFEAGVPKGELAWQSRLSGLARMHDARVVLLTRAGGEAPSLGPLVSLRVSASWERRGQHALLVPHVLKSKLGHVPALSPDVRILPRGAG